MRNLPFQFHEEQDADRHCQHYRPDYDDGPATPLRERRKRFVNPEQGVYGEDGGRTDHAATIRPLWTVSMQDLTSRFNGQPSRYAARGHVEMMQADSHGPRRETPAGPLRDFRPGPLHPELHPAYDFTVLNGAKRRDETELALRICEKKQRDATRRNSLGKLRVNCSAN